MILFAVSMWILDHLTTDAGESDVRFALLVRGFGLGLLFVPINAAAYRSIKPSEAQQASGLINLSRQLGGAFGIAVLANQVNVMTQTHRVELAASLVQGEPLTDERVQRLTRGLLARGMDAWHAHNAARAALNGQLQRQAPMLRNSDAWISVLVVFAIVAPSILLLATPPTTASEAMMEAH